MSKIFLWRYNENRRNYPGYHLTADQEGCNELQKILAQFETTQELSTYIFDLAPLTQSVLDVPNNARGNKTAVTYRSFRLIVDPKLSGRFFKFTEAETFCELKLSPAQAGCVLEGVKDIKNDKGDYCIGGDGDHVIWFWWFRA